VQKKTAILGWEEGELKIALHAIPQKGEANRELVLFLSKLLGIPQRNIILLQGETSRHKKILIEDMEEEELKKYLAQMN
jgi:uncharacterized protein (TIGR00251 family)